MARAVERSAARRYDALILIAGRLASSDWTHGACRPTTTQKSVGLQRRFVAIRDLWRPSVTKLVVSWHIHCTFFAMRLAAMLRPGASFALVKK
jgi:hypothetical protein